MFSRKKFSDVKSLINLALVRLNTKRKKVSQELNLKKRVLAKHLQEHDFALARLEAERIVKLDWKVEAFNMIEIKCEEVRDNVPLLKNSKTVPLDLDEAVSTVIYCNERAGIPELKEVVRVLERKYGQEYIEMQKDNGAKRVDERLVHRLSGQRPNAFLVYNYMKEIAANFGIEWVEDEATKVLGQRFDIPMSAGAAGVASASGLGAAAYAVTDGRIMPKGTKPKGFVPPTKPDMDKDFLEIDKNNEAADDDDDDDEEGGDQSPPPKHSPKPPSKQVKPPLKPKNVTPKPKATPKPAKAEDDGLTDLQKRFDALKDL